MGEEDEFGSSGLIKTDSTLVGHQEEMCKSEPAMWFRNLKEVQGGGAALGVTGHKRCLRSSKWMR